MSRLDENDLISKFVSALTIFSERSAALEARVLSELGGMRNDINQLKQTVLSESAVSVPQVMEQQRMTMIELIRQIQPIIAAQQAPIQQAPIQPPTIAVAPTQQPTLMHPIQQATIQPPTIAVAPIQPQTNQSTQPISASGSQFILKEGEWHCPACYVKNEAGQSVCVCCQTPKAGTAQPSSQPKSTFKPQTFNTGSTALFPSPATEKPPLSTLVQAKDEKPPIAFSFAPNKPVKFLFNPNVPQENKSLFGGNAAPIQANAKPLFGGGSGSANASFASVAGGGNDSFLNKSGSNANAFNVDPKQYALFSGAKGSSVAVVKKQDGGEDDGAEKDETEPEEFVPDESQFKRPDIALPDLVEVKTGEEDEEVLFSARCRLYRFIPGAEAKERGTGDMKLLKNRESGKVRCVMRREQVLKLCANFAISSGFTVNNTQRGENVLTWACRDYSNTEVPEGENMTLICRFKDVEAAKKFKDITQSVTV